MPDQQRATPFDGLRGFLAACEDAGEVLVIKDADWNLEINTLTEAVAEHIPEPPLLPFDNIKDCDAGFRVMCLPKGSVRRIHMPGQSAVLAGRKITDDLIAAEGAQNA